MSTPALLDDVPTGRDTVHVALVSGGKDSTVAAAVAADLAPKLDYLTYLDTRTGLDANRKYVEQLADALGYHCMTLRTKESYEANVKEHGFPGPAQHQTQYISLKERSIQKLAGITGDKHLVLWTGVRANESQRRMGHVDPVQEGKRGRWTWVAPIHDWSSKDCEEYLAERELPANELWSTLGRSGDCFCGCFGSPEEKLDLRAAGCEEHAEWIESLEEQVETGDEREVWAWGGLSDTEARAERADRDDHQMQLCSRCERYPVADDDVPEKTSITDRDHESTEVTTHDKL